MDGRSLKRVLRTDEAFLLLDEISNFPGIDWTHGGCQILAKSLKMLLPEGEIKMVWNLRLDQAEHCVFLHRGRIYDGNGSSHPAACLDRFAKEEFPEQKQGVRGFCLLPYEPDACRSMPNIHDSRLADFLAERLDIRVACAMLR